MSEESDGSAVLVDLAETHLVWARVAIHQQLAAVFRGDFAGVLMHRNETAHHLRQAIRLFREVFPR